jgi:hypothetical protein
VNNVLGMNHSVDAYMLEVWYEWLGTETSKTSFLPLSTADAEALKRACELRKIRRKNVVVGADEEEQNLVAGLEARMDSIVLGGCFVKLSARSCKDSILRSTHFKAVLQNEVDQLKQRKLNDLLCAYVRAQCFALKRTGQESENCVVFLFFFLFLKDPRP